MYNIQAGDIRQVRYQSEQRSVLVLKVQPENKNAQVTLVHSYPEFATGSDVIIEASVTNLPYSLVVQPSMRGIVWLDDLGTLASYVPLEVVKICLSPSNITPTGAGLSNGLKMGGKSDTRWAFKDREYKTLSRLVEDCTASALSE